MNHASFLRLKGGYLLSPFGMKFDISDDRKTTFVNSLKNKYENGSYYSMNLKGLKSDDLSDIFKNDFKNINL